MGTTDPVIPVIDLEPFLHGRHQREVMRELTTAMTEVGVVIVRDPRLPPGLPATMRAMLERFYRLPEDIKRELERIETHHNIGWTPPFTEGPSPRIEIRNALPDGHKPFGSVETEGELKGRVKKDPKERFMFPVGPRPAPFATRWPEYNTLDKLVPEGEGFEDWVPQCTQMGEAMLETVFTVIEMTSVGMGCFDPCVFTSLMHKGPHLFAPTGCDLNLFRKAGTVHAGFHNDMGFCTIHGKSNYPGLRVWTRQGRRIDRIPIPDDGCLLIQAANQWQDCTGGAILAGLHEVVASDELERKAEAEIAQGLHPYRVSLTEFCHIRSDAMIQLYDIFDTPENRRKLAYKPVSGGQRLKDRFGELGLTKKGGSAIKGG